MRETLRADGWFIEIVPYGAFLRVDAEYGAEVSYIDLNHQIRSHSVGKSHRFFPCFMVPAVQTDLLVFLKGKLVEDRPHAQERLHFIRYGARGDDTFFLCTVWTK